jgi:polysaccharide export outer membrane protein
MIRFRAYKTSRSLAFPIRFFLVFLLVACSTLLSVEYGLAEEAGDSASVETTTTEPGPYLIGPGDVLEIVVWKEPDVSRTIRVRPDGKISLPLVDDVQAAGGTPLELKKLLTRSLSKYVEEPSVYVILEENRSKTYHVIGKVNSPGPYLLERDTSVLQALAMAQGFTEWAKKDDVVVVRGGPGSQTLLEFDYNKVVSGEELEQNILLSPGDVIVVP